MNIAKFVELYGYKTVSLTLRDLMQKADVTGNDSVIIETMAKHLEAALKELTAFK